MSWKLKSEQKLGCDFKSGSTVPENKFSVYAHLARKCRKISPARKAQDGADPGELPDAWPGAVVQGSVPAGRAGSTPGANGVLQQNQILGLW